MVVDVVKTRLLGNAVIWIIALELFTAIDPASLKGFIRNS